MTTIAYRDGVIAADSLISDGSGMRCGEMMKIAASDQVVGGCAGGISNIHAFLEWIKDGAADKCPHLDAPADGILVRGGQAFFVGSDGVPVPFKGKFAVAGSGGQLALGAMAMGADAITAVKIAIKHDTGSGGKVVSLRLR